MDQQNMTGRPRFWQGQRFRRFVILSLAVHATVGAIWGVPGYVRMKKEEAQQREVMLTLQRQREATEAAIARAKADAIEKTRAEVEATNRRTFETLVRELPQSQREKVWDKVSAKLTQASEAFAKALADSSHTEQDLRNIQADLNRQLVEEADSALAANVTQDLADDFVAAVRQNVVPEAIRFYSEKVDQQIGRRLREDADRFVGTSRKRSEDSATAIRSRLEGALRSVDAVRIQATAAPDDGRTKEANRRADEARSLIAEAAKRAADVDGVQAVAAAMEPAAEATIELAQVAKQADEELRARKTAQATATFARVTLTEARLRPLITRANELTGACADVAEMRAREAVGWARDKSLSTHIDRQFADAFAKSAAERLTDAIMERFKKQLDTRSIKDERVARDVRQQVVSMLNREVGATGSYHIPGTKSLEDVARKASDAAGTSDAFRDRFAQDGQKTIDRGIAEIMKDAGADGRLADRANLPAGGMEDDVRYRLETLAGNAREGRTLGLLDNVGSGSLTQMREGALLRNADVEQMQAMAAAGGAFDGQMPATTQTASAEQVAQELASAIRFDFNMLLGGKLQNQSGQIWDDLMARTNSDLNALARALLDTNVSDQELENQRLEFSLKFLAQMQGSLDKTAAGEMSSALLAQLRGKAGDRIAGRYQSLVRDALGAALQRELQAAADQKRGALWNQSRKMALTLDAVRETANRASDLAGQSRERMASPSTQPAAAARAEMPVIGQIDKALDAAGRDLGTVADAAGGHAAAVGESVKAANAAIGEMDKAAEAAQHASGEGDAAGAAKSLETVRTSAGAVNKAVDAAQGALGKEADAAVVRFARAVRQAERGNGTDRGIREDVASAFDAQFTGEMLPRLADAAIEGYKRKVQGAGLNVSEVDEKQLRADVVAALSKKVNGEAMGDAAIGRIEESAFMRQADNEKADPQAVADVRQMAKGVIGSSLGRIGGDGGPGDEAGGAGGGVPGPDGAFGEVKGRVGQYANSLRGGRGGLLAGLDGDGGEGDGAGARGRGLFAIRGKWQGQMAGGGAGMGAGGVGAGGAGAGNGRGGRGMFRGTGRGTLVRFDEEQYAKLTAEMKDRDKKTARGETWDRQGALGLTSRVADEEAVHPAALLVPATQPAALVSNDQPYTPTFKSIKFMSVPYLNTPFAMDGDMGKWKDIPSFELRPERGDGQGIEGLRIVDHLAAKMAWDATGLYVMVDVVDADNKLLMATALGGFALADVAEIWVDPLNAKERQRARGAGQQFWIWPDGGNGHPEYTGGESSKDLNTAFIPTAFTNETLQRFTRKTPEGYTLEFHLPMQRLRDAEMAAGKIVGFNMTVETGTKIHYYWSSSKVVGTWGRPDTWGDVLLAGSDGKLEIPARLSWERSADDKDTLLQSFVVGEPLRIRVTDRDMNLSSASRDKISVTARSAHGVQEVAILEETGDDTGVFEGSIRTALSYGERVPGTLSVYEGEKIAITYIDQARANGARNAQLQFTVRAGAVVTARGTREQ